MALIYYPAQPRAAFSRGFFFGGAVKAAPACKPWTFWKYGTASLENNARLGNDSHDSHDSIYRIGDNHRKYFMLDAARSPSG
jgi:hypothetical protein